MAKNAAPAAAPGAAAAPAPLAEFHMVLFHVICILTWIICGCFPFRGFERFDDAMMQLIWQSQSSLHLASLRSADGKPDLRDA